MNYIYTYVPKSDDKKLDSEFYLIDVILLMLSVIRLKRYKNQNEKIIFYSTQEFSQYFKSLNVFDEIRIVPSIEDYLDNQSYEYCHKNCLYKIFVATLQDEPFITLDHDFIINDGEFLNKIRAKDLIFSFREYLNNESYVNIYLPTYKNVVNTLGKNEDVLNLINQEYSINVSISGGKRLDIIKESYKKITGFYIRNYKYLNTIPLMTMFLEQFLLSGQLLTYDVEPYYCWEELNNGICTHYTGHRYESDNRKKISDELKLESPEIYDFIKTEFGFYSSYMS